MNATMAGWFEEGAGGFLTAAEFLWTIKAIGVVLALTYVAWLMHRAYADYGIQRIKSSDMIMVWFRAVFILMIFLFIVVN